MGKFKDTVDKILGKIDHTSERYEKALEAKQEELIQLQQQLQDASIKFKEFQKMHLLGDISDGTLKDAGADVEAITEKIALLQEQISLITAYEKEDIQAELAEIDKMKNEFNAERNEDVRRIQHELQSAKLAYLQAMLKAREDYLKVAGTDFKLADVLVKLGIKKSHYVGGAYDSVGFPSSYAGGTSYAVETPFVDQATAHEALQYGKIPSSLVQFVERGTK